SRRTCFYSPYLTLGAPSFSRSLRKGWETTNLTLRHSPLSTCAAPHVHSQPPRPEPVHSRCAQIHWSAARPPQASCPRSSAAIAPPPAPPEVRARPATPSHAQSEFEPCPATNPPNCS